MAEILAQSEWPSLDGWWKRSYEFADGTHYTVHMLDEDGERIPATMADLEQFNRRIELSNNWFCITWWRIVGFTKDKL